ncbi:hypothetical protein [Paucibacter soli]|uniref:hypothetical protein n=1 Tax=Paucibacter soli TaxID=3133433 RepID=UPI0030A1C39F
MLEQCLKILREALSQCFTSAKPEIVTNWAISGRTVSEIGGRLIEDYVLLHLPEELKKTSFEGRIECDIPESGRAVEDIAVDFYAADWKIRLLVDVKGHNELQRGSRPNLASIRKCIDLYEAKASSTTEVVVFYCRYVPSIGKMQRSKTVSLAVQPSSFTETGVFLLRQLSDANLDPANIGSGGQLLFAREHEVRIVDRSRAEFVSLLRQFQGRLAEAKSRSKGKAMDA